MSRSASSVVFRESSIISAEEELELNSFNSQSSDTLVTQLTRTLNEKYIIYIEDKRAAFLQWWDKTSWKKSVEQEDSKLFLSTWDRFKSKKSTAWNNYIELAIVKIDESFLMCKLCKIILINSQSKENDIITISRHTERDDCKKKRPRGNQATIEAVIDVSLNNL